MTYRDSLEELISNLEDIRLEAMFNDDLDLPNNKSCHLFLIALSDIEKATNALKLSILELDV